jgi:hypothetical protein
VTGTGRKQLNLSEYQEAFRKRPGFPELTPFTVIPGFGNSPKIERQILPALIIPMLYVTCLHCNQLAFHYFSGFQEIQTVGKAVGVVAEDEVTGKKQGYKLETQEEHDACDKSVIKAHAFISRLFSTLDRVNYNS